MIFIVVVLATFDTGILAKFLVELDDLVEEGNEFGEFFVIADDFMPLGLEVFGDGHCFGTVGIARLLD